MIYFEFILPTAVTPIPVVRTFLTGQSSVENVDDMTTLKDDMKRSAVSPERHRFMDEDPWCKTADPG
jgi:hypothetical protein